MSVVQVQFYIQFRGQVTLEARLRGGENAEMLARQFVDKAVAEYNRAWPGTLRNELKALGITNGKYTLNAIGNPAPLFPLIPGVAFVGPHDQA